MFELVKSAQSMLETCTLIKPGDLALVIDDNEGRTIWLGQIFAEALNLIGAKAVLMAIPPRPPGQSEPPATVAAAMKCANAIFCISDKPSIGHSYARQEANTAGARFWGLMKFEIDDLRRSVSAKDVQLIVERTEKLARKLTEADTARLTTPEGTNLTMSLKGREGIALHSQSYLTPALPDYAEAAISPVEGSAEGTVVIDLTVSGWDYLFQEPLRFTVKAGKVTEVSGSDQEVDRFRKLCATDQTASNIAELGIGTSHIVMGAIRGRHRDKARLGTAHIAVGRNDDIGGKTWSAIHADCVMNQATLELDGECVLKDGTLTI